MSAFRSQRGLALISALLIVSLAGILGAGQLFRLQLEIQSTSSLIGNARARMVALGIEDLAAEMLAMDAYDNDTDHRRESWAAGIGAINVGPMQVQGAMEDMQGRFNVNNLVTLQGTADLIAAAQFRRLLRILELNENLAEKVLDWIDADNFPAGPGGAEDEAYIRRTPPYQAPNRPIGDVSELLAVEGLDAETWRILSPHITALPVTGGPTPLNVNTATREALLSLSSSLDPSQVQRWLEWQQLGGLVDLSEVQSALPSNMAARVSVGSNWFRLQLAVTADGTRFFLTSLLDRGSGEVRTVWRRQGLPAEAWLAPVAG